MKITAELIATLGYGNLLNFVQPGSTACIDSRKVTAGAVFFALRGEKTDGHCFVGAAIDQGAVLAVVADAWWKQQTAPITPVWVVPSPEEALRRLAAAWRRQFDIPVLAITGSNGKTTTRAMCREVLSRQWTVHSTSGNFNNEIGLPLSLLECDSRHQISVLEMGTNHFGEITRLCRIAAPTAGLITNVGDSHLEFLGNRQGVARAKAELLTALPATGVAFINLADSLIKTMPVNCSIWTFGMDTPDAKVAGKIIGYSAKGQPTLEINGMHQIKLQVAGRAAACNALAAFAVGQYFGLSAPQMSDALESYQPVYQRFLPLQSRRCQIIDDTYNANPDSVCLALEGLQLLKTTGRHIAVLGDMFELGDQSVAGHRRIGECAARCGIDLLCTLGPRSIETAQAACELGLPIVFDFADKVELLDFLVKEVQPDDIVLVKGSRGMMMEEIVKGLMS